VGPALPDRRAIRASARLVPFQRKVLGAEASREGKPGTELDRAATTRKSKNDLAGVMASLWIRAMVVLDGGWAKDLWCGVAGDEVGSRVNTTFVTLYG
jgi:hypothetical protein